ncbi:hypothetical protein RFI_14691, partial [Reticulomyxa filosa]
MESFDKRFAKKCASDYFFGQPQRFYYLSNDCSCDCTFFVEKEQLYAEFEPETVGVWDLVCFWKDTQPSVHSVYRKVLLFLIFVLVAGLLIWYMDTRTAGANTWLISANEKSGSALSDNQSKTSALIQSDRSEPDNKQKLESRDEFVFAKDKDGINTFFTKRLYAMKDEFLEEYYPIDTQSKLHKLNEAMHVNFSIRMPKTLIVGLGCKKCGTSSFRQYVQQITSATYTPGIVLNEIHYWDSCQAFFNSKDLQLPILCSFADYLRYMFLTRGQVSKINRIMQFFFEKSPTYLTSPSTAISLLYYIHFFTPAMVSHLFQFKIFVLLRDPVKRLWSDFSLSYDWYLEAKESYTFGVTLTY